MAFIVNSSNSLLEAHTMRTVKEINVDIKKLKAELKLAQAAE